MAEFGICRPSTIMGHKRGYENFDYGNDIRSGTTTGGRSDEDLGTAFHHSHVEGYYEAPRGSLTNRCHGHIIFDKSDEET